MAVLPSLQIKLRIQVQNNTYINLIIKINAVLGTRQVNDPKE